MKFFKARLENETSIGKKDASGLVTQKKSLGINDVRAEWRVNNAGAIDAYNARVKRDGVFGDCLRDF